MADMMAGQWYARSCGLPPVLPEGQGSVTPPNRTNHSSTATTRGSGDGVASSAGPGAGEMALSCFRTIFECNVVRFSEITRR